MKKYNPILNNKSILYLLFILTLANLVYFIYSKDNYSILIFSLIAILIYLFTQNMIIVLGLTIFIVNILILARDSKEGYEDMSYNDISNCSDFTDAVYRNLYSNDISDIPMNVKSFKDKLSKNIDDTREGGETDYVFYNEYKNELNNLDSESKKWLNYNVINPDRYKRVCSKRNDYKSKIEPLQNEIGITIKDSEHDGGPIKNVIKNYTSEVDGITKTFDMNELNRLINKLNNITDQLSSRKT